MTRPGSRGLEDPAAPGADHPLTSSVVRSEATAALGVTLGVIVTVQSLSGSGVLQAVQEVIPGEFVKPQCGHSIAELPRSLKFTVHPRTHLYNNHHCRNFRKSPHLTPYSILNGHFPLRNSSI